MKSPLPTSTKKTFIVYYKYGEEIDKMRLELAEESWNDVREIFYDSVPENGSKIMAIKEL